MWNGDFGIMPIVEDDLKVIGVITDRDIAMAVGLQRKPASEIHVGDVINHQELAACHPIDDVEKVLEVMETRKVRRLPVIDDNGRISGVVSLCDIAAYAGRGGKASCSPTRLVEALTSIATPHLEHEKSLATA